MPIAHRYHYIPRKVRYARIANCGHYINVGELITGYITPPCYPLWVCMECARTRMVTNGDFAHTSAARPNTRKRFNNAGSL